MRVADLMRDAHLLPEIQNTAKTLLVEHPDKVKLLIERWLGKSLDYSNV
jgi:ATP-dependent DNA helicase RecG